MLKIILSLVVLALFNNKVFAEPMPSPTIEQACRSVSIVIAEYQGWRSEKPVTYFDAPIAKFKIIENLSGKSLTGEIEVRFESNDGSACIAPDYWKLEMPEVNSRWILFLNPESSSNLFSTYRGNFGRLKFDPKNKNIALSCKNVSNS